MMALKYKLDDVVVIGESTDTPKGFTPGVAVRIGELCGAGTDSEYYTIYRLDGKVGAWWVQDSEIDHEATEALQKSNETGDIVGKEQAVSDDSAKGVRTPILEENASQTAIQAAIEAESNHPCGAFASVYSSVSVFRKGSIKEGDSIFYSEDSTKISLEDDGGGAFLVVEQDYNGAIQQIRLDFEEVDAVFSAAKKLMLQYNNGI